MPIEKYPDLTGPVETAPVSARSLDPLREVQVVDRTDHLSMHGVEVKRQFSVMPYKAWLPFVAAMEGYVGSEAGKRKRFFPNIDPFTGCAWTDCIVTPLDSDGVMASRNLNWIARRAMQKGSDRDTLHALTNTPFGEQFSCPALVTGVYRPLISLSKEDGVVDHVFDWLEGEPTFLPGSFTLPRPDGLRWSAGRFANGQWETLNDAVTAPVTISTIEVTIRRSLLPVLYGDLWNYHVGKVNSQDWTPAKTKLPRFPAETLRFDSWKPTLKHALRGNYFDVEFKFTWINQIAKNVQARDGSFPGGSDWITWNHVLMRPRKSVPVPVAGAAVWVPIPAWIKEDLGWYRPVITEAPLRDLPVGGAIAQQIANRIFGAPPPAGFLYNTVDNFDQLFILQPVGQK